MSETLHLPSKLDRRWRDLVLGVNTTPPRLLALKFMLSRLTMAAKKDPSPAAVQRGIDELYEFFLKNSRMVEADAATLFR
jgi:hypothetical protein